MKKILLITLSCLDFLAFARAQQAKIKYNQGRERIFTIMYEGNGGINNYNRNITYAQTLNLSEDINLPAATLYFPTQTDIGQTFLFDTFEHVVSPKDTNATIAKRQQVIKSLVDNPELCNQITQLLDQAQQAELLVTELMTNRDQALEKLKFPDLSHMSFLEYSMIPWHIWDQLTKTNALANATNQLINAIAAPTLASTSVIQAKFAYNEFKNPDLKLFDDKKSERWYTAWSLPQEYTYDEFKFRVKNSMDLAEEGTYTDEVNRLYNYSTTAVATGLAAENRARALYSDYTQGLKNRKLIYGLNQFVVIAEQLEALCSQHGIPAQFRPSSVKNPKGIAMIEGLKHPRYQNKEESFVISTPWINTFVNEIYEQDIFLAPIFATIAEMDAYHAIAKKMVEQAETENKLCFAQVIGQVKPKFDAKGFWNVIVPNAIPNNLVEERNIILTGPNAGGKSTVIRAILQNIVFSQTFGFAAALFFAATPYDVIESSLRVSDDVTKGLSRYASELKRGSETVLRAKILQPGERFFFVLDELFTGTNAKDGEAAAYELIHDDLASSFNQIQFIFATHFDKLKQMEKTNPKNFANYKIDAPTTSAQGKLIYPYTLSKGVNNSYIALQMKREAGLMGNKAAIAA